MREAAQRARHHARRLAAPLLLALLERVVLGGDDQQRDREEVDLVQVLVIAAVGRFEASARAIEQRGRGARVLLETRANLSESTCE